VSVNGILRFHLDYQTCDPAHNPVDKGTALTIVKTVLADQADLPLLQALVASGQELELGIQVVADAEMATLNRAYRGKEGATNVLSFAMNDDEPQPTPMLGDIVIALGVVRREATEFGLPLLDRMAHMMVHGVLHLLGWDHERNEVEADAQEAVEAAILERLGFRMAEG